MCINLNCIFFLFFKLPSFIPEVRLLIFLSKIVSWTAYFRSVVYASYNSEQGLKNCNADTDTDCFSGPLTHNWFLVVLCFLEKSQHCQATFLLADKEKEMLTLKQKENLVYRTS